MKSYQIIRLNTSPYQATNFMASEKYHLESTGPFIYKNLNEFDQMLQTILITNTHTDLALIDKEVLNSTELIIHPNSGYEHFEKDLSLIKKIPMIIGHQIRALAVAEYSLSCLFEAVTELPNHLHWDKERKWPRKLIGESKIAIFGHGHIGKIVSNTLKAMGAQVYIIDPYINEQEHTIYKKWQEIPLKDCLAVISCMGLNSTNHKIFNEDFFANTSPELIFINGARGKLVDEKALIDHLRLNKNIRVFLDVFNQEPFGQEWLGIPQVWKTSHIAGVCKNLDQEIINFEKKVLVDFLKLDLELFKQTYRNELFENKIQQGILI